MFAIATTLAIKHLPESQGVLVAAICTTVILLIFSETVPKTIATQHSEKLSLTFAQSLRMLSWLLSPLVIILSGIATFFRKLMSGNSIPKTFFSVNEILTMICAGQQEGEVKESEAELLHDVFDFFNLTVREVMVPRPDTDAIERGSTLADFRSLFIKETAEYPSACWGDESGNLRGGMRYLRKAEIIRRFIEYQAHEDETIQLYMFD